MNSFLRKIHIASLFFFLKILLQAGSKPTTFTGFSNQMGPFRGGELHPGYKGSTWLTHPEMKGPASIDFDPQGRAFINEARRMAKGVPDTRGSEWITREDYLLKTVEDRLASYQRNQDKVEMAWYTGTTDRVLRFVDTDGNGVPDTGTVFDDRCKETLDGIGFTVLAERDAVYYTCIPSLRKLTDKDGDGYAEQHVGLVEGFGVRNCFKGHDLHGVIRGPDGLLYFSVGDRGYSVVDDHGVRRSAPQRGAVFRCQDDGSNFEVYAHGLRNPQEIAFDEFGNLFTFDNTGDFGDRARVVYVLDNTDSGWTADYQSHHQHANKLDWGDFRLWQATWVGEGSCELYSPSAPQWIYPPVGHVGNGPSGVVQMTGPAVPPELLGKFLMCNFRGSPTRSEVLTIAVEAKGSGFKVGEVTPFLSALNASDVALGYDGRVYFVEYGSGWRPDDQGSIQVAEPVDSSLQKAGKEVAQLVKEGFAQRSLSELNSLLNHTDQRVRQEAQFAIVKKGPDQALALFSQVLLNAKEGELAPLHAVWGLGQLARMGNVDAKKQLVQTLSHSILELRANAARTCGDSKISEARDALLAGLKDISPRVASLSAVALGRISPVGNEKSVNSLIEIAEKNHGASFDITLRHAILSALHRITTPAQALSWSKHTSAEVRLLGVIILRKMEHPGISDFLNDSDKLVKHEAIRALYDTSAVDEPAGAHLLKVDYQGLPVFIQARLLVGAARRGTAEGFARVLEMATDSSLDSRVQTLAFHALEKWDQYPSMDPFLGSLRPSSHPREKSHVLAGKHSSHFLNYLKHEKRTKFLTLATEVSAVLGIALNIDDLQNQVLNRGLSSKLRVAFYNRLLQEEGGITDGLLLQLLEDPDSKLCALALREAYNRNLDGVAARAEKTVRLLGAPELAKQAIISIGARHPERLVEFWNTRSGENGIDRSVWLDLYREIEKSSDPEIRSTVKRFSSKPANLYSLALSGGDAALGAKVFEGQGACMQCHKINGKGGEQGPDLSLVGKRLGRGKLLESIVNPSAEITPGYGLSTVMLKNGEAYSGRLAGEGRSEVKLVTMDGKDLTFDRNEVSQVTPPISAMPPMGQALSKSDLRDLIAYLESTRSSRGSSVSLKHGN